MRGGGRKKMEKLKLYLVVVTECRLVVGTPEVQSKHQLPLIETFFFFLSLHLPFVWAQSEVQWNGMKAAERKSEIASQQKTFRDGL